MVFSTSFVCEIAMTSQGHGLDSTAIDQGLLVGGFCCQGGSNWYIVITGGTADAAGAGGVDPSVYRNVAEPV
ncbi:hypothetical protein RRF57_000669 [Xylaria bambusicola]|uniref:Uncharacterized protein n=1 Tax=Xylaria bambusicola TaxID=326684 RepID=A0AAN7Z2R4_9PEZI